MVAIAEFVKLHIPHVFLLLTTQNKYDFRREKLLVLSITYLITLGLYMIVHICIYIYAIFVITLCFALICILHLMVEMGLNLPNSMLWLMRHLDELWCYIPIDPLLHPFHLWCHVVVSLLNACFYGRRWRMLEPYPSGIISSNTVLNWW